MAHNIDVLIIDFNENPDGTFSIKFSYDGDPDDVKLAADEETSIEVPSHAPPPAPKKGE